MKRNFLFFLTKEHKKLEDCHLPFLNINIYLVLELQSSKDAKIKAKSMNTKHAILVISHTLNKYSLGS